MAGFVMMTGFCCNCRRMVSFAPTKVPSLMINGKREPLCRACAERWNEMHPEKARPIQDGAYEAQPEDEVF